MKFAVAILCSVCCFSAESTRTAIDPGTPFPPKELLRYNIAWASGLSLGDAQLSADRGELAFQAEAAIPKFPLAEWAHSVVAPGLCSVEFEKKAVRGPKKIDEKITFDQDKLQATRQTMVEGGGKSTVSISPCAHDAVAYLYFLRRELAQGRLPKVEQVLYGAPYQVTVQYTGKETIKVGDQRTDSDRVNLTIKGPKSNVTVQAFFARDAVRTPVLVRVPLAVGTITMELAR